MSQSQHSAISTPVSASDTCLLIHFDRELRQAFPNRFYASLKNNAQWKEEEEEKRLIKSHQCALSMPSIYADYVSAVCEHLSISEWVFIP